MCGRYAAKSLLAKNSDAREFFEQLSTIKNECQEVCSQNDERSGDLWERISARIESEERAAFYLGSRREEPARSRSSLFDKLFKPQVVVGGLSGSALLREPDLALRLIEAVTSAVDVPVTLKTRLGWDGDCLNTPAIARRAEAAGIRMLTIHGRTRQQFYTGQADWSAIARIRAEVSIPVIANGDIRSPADAATALRLSGAAGVMVGRGAQGAPWVPVEIAHALCGTPAPVVPRGAALVTMVTAHHVDMLHFYGRDLGLRVARKHLGWYMDRAGTPPALRAAVLTAATPDQVHALLPDALSGHGLEQAA